MCCKCLFVVSAETPDTKRNGLGEQKPPMPAVLDYLQEASRHPPSAEAGGGVEGASEKSNGFRPPQPFLSDNSNL